MHRGWKGLGLGVLIVGCATPPLIGQVLERGVRSGMAHALEGPRSLLAQNGLQDFVKVSAPQYRSGLLRSSHSFTVWLGCAGQEGRPLEIAVNSTLEHGPFPGFSGVGLVRVHTELALRSGGHTPLERALVGQRLTLDTTLGLDRALHSSLNLPAGRVSAGGTRLEWATARGELSAAASGTALRYRLELPRARLDQTHQQRGARLASLNLRDLGRGTLKLETLKLETLGLEALKLEGSARPPTPDGSGSSSAQQGSVQRLSLGSGGQTVSLEGVRMDASTSVVSEQGGWRYTLEADRAGVADQQARDLVLRLGMDRLKMDSLEQLIGGLGSGPSGNVCAPPPTTRAALSGFKLLGPALELMRGGPTLRLERLAFRFPEGETVLSGQAGFADPGRINLLFNPASALEQLRASLRFSGSQAALSRLGLGERLAGYAANGLLRRRGDRLESELKLEKRRLTANGTEVGLGL